jgi:hypothetical protein
MSESLAYTVLETKDGERVCIDKETSDLLKEMATWTPPPTDNSLYDLIHAKVVPPE